MFAYCENDPVNYTDVTGTWAYDVHAGYENKYSRKRPVRVKNQMFYEMRITVYGTYEWALECGYPDYAAWMIAQSNYLVDKEFSAITVNNFNDQGWHFNVNTSGMDSRDAKSLVCLFAASVYFYETIVAWDEGYVIRAKVNLGKAYQYLGAALHPLQDKYAHTRKVTNYRNIKGIKFYEHKVYDLKNPKKKADDAKAHKDVVFGVVKNETKDVLETFMKKNSYAIKNITPDENLWFLFPNSYKKAKKYVDLD